MKNITYKPYQKMTPWRKTSVATWKPTGDSSCYCFEDVIIDEILVYCKRNLISINSFLIKAFSNTLKLQPKINSTIRGRKIFSREDISVFFHTIIDAQSDDLSGIVIREGQDKSVNEINSEFLEKIKDSKEGITDFSESKEVVKKTPSFMVKPLLKLYSYISYRFNKNVKAFKSKPNAFGSIMLTSVGSIGITRAFCPIAPYTKVPMVVSVGKIDCKPVVVDAKVHIKKMLTLGFTFDHRIMDGIHFAEFFNCLSRYFKNPKLIESDEEE